MPLLFLIWYTVVGVVSLSSRNIPYLIRKLFPDFVNDYNYYRETFSTNRREINRLRDENMRLEYLIKGVNDIAKDNNLIGIRKTKKEEYAILYRHKMQRYEFDVCIDIPFGDKTRNVLNLLATLDNEKKTIEIDDIQIAEEDTHKGYGTLALSYFIEKSKKDGIKKIYGTISSKDYIDHGERLVAFYEKFEFNINICGTSGAVTKYL
jgi:N-acetylglutamate synthase-like GNAT family acetyltransferase